MGGDFPPKIFAAELPFSSTADDRIVVMYEIDNPGHVLTCYLLEEVGSPTRIF